MTKTTTQNKTAEGGRSQSAKAKDLKQALSEEAPVQVLDIRNSWDFGSAHVPGAVNIPAEAVAKRAEAVLDKSRPVWVMCDHGNQSRFSAATLSSRGFDVVDVRDGFRGWRLAGYPLSERTGVARITTPLFASLTLGLAPFAPEPHIVGKVRWILGDPSGMQPMDIFDTFLHGAPWLWLLWTVADIVISSVKSKSAG